MALDSRAKGARGEYLVRDKLREASGLQFERVPASGALAYLKGDLFVPHKDCRFLIEVKNYEESPFTDKIFTNRSNNIVNWWAKAVEQAALREQEPVVIFKYNRSKLFVLTNVLPTKLEKFMFINWLGCYAMLLEDWLTIEDIQWLRDA